MTGEKIHRLLKTLSDLSDGSVIWMPTKEEIDEAAAQLMSLIKRSEELQKRELGARVSKHGPSPHHTHICENCGQCVGGALKIKTYKYCSHCGYRLNHEIDKKEPETYTVQINGKDVILKKGVEYEFIFREK